MSSSDGWTRSVPPDDAPDKLRPLYEAAAARSSHGEVSHLWRSLGLDPRVLNAVLESSRALFDDATPLTASQAQLIGLVVAATNGCGYCVAHHGTRLASLGDEKLARAVALDYRQANLAARDRVMLDYAVALTCEPGERTRADVERLREYGFDDAAIVRVTAL